MVVIAQTPLINSKLKLEQKNQPIMKKIYILFISFLITGLSFGQSLILLEDFTGTAQYTLPNHSGTFDILNNTGSYFTRTDGSDISSPINFTDGDFYFAAQAIGTGSISSPETMLFSNINIATFTNMTFGVALANINDAWDDTDFVHFEYKIDGGAWTNMIWVENGGATNSAPQIDADFNGVGDGLVFLINEFNDDVLFNNFSGPGTSMDIRITFGGLTGVDENIAMASIFLVNDFQLFPDIAITSPTDSQIFPSGTTSVPITYTLINPGSIERVDITVNTVLTSSIGAGPFDVTTSDGEFYDAEIRIFAFGGIEVSSWWVSFSVSNTLGIEENKIEGFSFSPNPTKLGYINISSKSNSRMGVSVFDILGKQVLKETISNNKLSVSNLNAGIYIMKVSQDNATITKKLVIQ
ncbi:MAG: hypothetical protein ACI9OE_002431 [Mariniflexile sp.]|jgi:hypothetical protein